MNAILCFQIALGAFCAGVNFGRGFKDAGFIGVAITFAGAAILIGRVGLH